MKNLDIGANLLKVFVGPLTLCCLVFNFYFHTALLTLLHGSYYFLFACICIGLSSFGRIKLAPTQASPESFPKQTNKPQSNPSDPSNDSSLSTSLPSSQQRLPTLLWLTGLLALQGLLGLLFVNFNQVLLYYCPSEFSQPIQNTELFSPLLNHLLGGWGLYPWSLYALLALSYGYFVYHQGRSGSLSSTLISQYQPRLHRLIAPSVDFLARASNICCIALVLAFSLLAINPLIGQFAHFHYFHPYIFRTLTVAFLCYWFLIAPATQNLVKRLCQKGYSLGGILFIIALAVTFLLAFGNYVSSLLAHGHALADTRQQTAPLQQHRWLNDWLLINWTWLFVWTPCIASAIARLSRGRSLRELVLASLGLPLCLSLLWYPAQYHPLAESWMQTLQTMVPTHWFHDPVVMAILGLFNLVFVCTCLRSKQAFAYLDYGALSHTQHSALRRPQRTTPQVLRFIGGLMGIFMIGWLLTLPIILLIVATSVLVPLNLSWIALCFALCQHREFRQATKQRKQQRQHTFFSRFIRKHQRKGLRSF